MWINPVMEESNGGKVSQFHLSAAG